jgi:hypothetical protein
MPLDMCTTRWKDTNARRMIFYGRYEREKLVHNDNDDIERERNRLGVLANDSSSS